jgi:hexaprenyl-diphosphate synthase
MIHVASLLHDDVIDSSPLRRSQPSAPSAFGNKLSILSGDFLLGRASVALARLGSREVVELLATVIANLVEGEVMQLRATSEPETEPTRKGFEDYMRKTYLKTASLMAKSARAAVILGGCGRGDMEWVKDVAYGYGRNIGIAFQVSERCSSAAARRCHSTRNRVQPIIIPQTYLLPMLKSPINLTQRSIFSISVLVPWSRR